MIQYIFEFINIYIKHKECGDTQKVIAYFEQYQLQSKNILAQNNWTPAMYACRYGRLDLLKYFVEKNHYLEGQSPYSLIHAACFGNEYDVLKYLIDIMKREPTPQTYEQTPLKYVAKNENFELIELLISRGAYFIYNDFLHNLEIEKQSDQIKYKTRVMRQPGIVELIDVPNQYIYKAHETKDNVKEFLKFSRCRNICFIAYLYQQEKSNSNKIPIKNERFKALTQIVGTKHQLLLEFLVGPKILDSSKKN